MKKNSFYFLILLLCFCCLTIYGQRKEIAFEEYEKLVNKIGENTQKKSYRMINETTIYSSDGTKIKQTEKNISEFTPSGRERFLIQMENYDFNQNTIIERIKIDGVEYKKYNGGKWEVVSAITKVGGENVVPDRNYIKYYLTKNAQIDGQTVDILESEEEYISKIKRVKTSEVIETPIFQTWKWLIKDDLWLSLKMAKEKVNPKSLIVKSVWVYEYDPKINIEAPIK